jgi:hypothetical protein
VEKLMSREPLSAYERWTWDRCRQRIRSLKHRLGYGERLWVLGFELEDDGRLVDPFHGVEVFDPASAGPATEIPHRYSAVPEMYCLLSHYAARSDLPLSGERFSLAALDPIRRPELSAEDCAALLGYAEQDLATLQAAAVPFFGASLERGDLAFEVRALPRVPVAVVLWQGDEEVSAGGTLLFDSTARDYLPDLVEELAGLTVWRLRNILDPAVKRGYHHMAARAEHGADC